MLNSLSLRFVDIFPRRIELVRGVCIALMALVFVSPAIAEKGKLRERLTPEVMAVVYPGGAERLGPEEGSPPAIAVYQGDKAVAYVFSTSVASACSTAFLPARRAGRCAAPPPMRCRRTMSPARPSARAPCAPPSSPPL